MNLDMLKLVQENHICHMLIDNFEEMLNELVKVDRKKLLKIIVLTLDKS